MQVWPGLHVWVAPVRPDAPSHALRCAPATDWFQSWRVWSCACELVVSQHQPLQALALRKLQRAHHQLANGGVSGLGQPDEQALQVHWHPLQVPALRASDAPVSRVECGPFFQSGDVRQLLREPHELVQPWWVGDGPLRSVVRGQQVLAGGGRIPLEQPWVRTVVEVGEAPVEWEEQLPVVLAGREHTPPERAKWEWTWTREQARLVWTLKRAGMIACRVRIQWQV